MVAIALLLSACGSTPTPSREFPTQSWRLENGYDDRYLLAPGDTLEIIVHNAPELSREVVVAPDGRIRLPLSGPVTASARTVDEVRLALMRSLSDQLKSPDLDIIATGFASQRIFVGGEVANAGMFDLPGQIDPLQAIIMAGGFTGQARTKQVVLMRRMPGGDIRTAVFDMKTGIYDAEFAKWLPLRRFDVVYVPPTRIANQNRFIQQYIRQALPIEFSLFYDLRGGQR